MSSGAEIAVETTGLMTFQLLVGDGDEDVTSNFNIKSIAIDRECNRIPTATILIIDGNVAIQEYPASNESTFEPGSKIHIKAGYQFKDETIFKGIVTKHALKSDKKTSYLLVECKDEAFKLTLAKKNKIFYESTESEIFEEILKENNLECEVEATSFKHFELLQYCSTDWDFIQSRIQINNKLCFVEDGKLIIKAPDLGTSASVKASYGDNIYAFDAEIDTRGQFKSYEASSWNYSDQEVVTKTAENTNLNNTGNLSSPTLSEASGDGTISLCHTGQLADDILQSWAEAKSFYHQLNKIYGTVKIQGVHTIKPGNMLTLEGMSDRFNGDVFVSAVHHAIVEGNWYTTVKFGLHPEWFSETFAISQLPAAGMLPAINGLQIGIVSALEGDPKEEHRIQVKLPLISATEEGIWARVLALHAGENYGVHFLPEIGNEVLVGFLNDDPNEAIVLGSLFSNTNTAMEEYKDDNYKKVIMTKGEMKITLNDENQSVMLETPGGKQLLIDDKEGIVTLLDDNDNSMTMDADGIVMKSAKDLILEAVGDVKIDGANVKINASTAFEGKGSGSAEISSSGTTTVKGGTVNIN